MRLWSEAETQRLLRGHAEGLTGSQLAKLMGEGFTKNMVVSKLDRMGLKLRSGLVAKQRPQPSLRRTEVTNIVVLATNAKALLALKSNECRFPIGDDPILFCGHPIAQGSYCAGHHAIAYRQTPPPPPPQYVVGDHFQRGERGKHRRVA